MTSFLREHGLWAEPRRPVPAGRGALFLDRDGVIVEERHYLHRVEDVALTPDAGGLIARANGFGIPVVMITNQAGIGRGLYDWQAFESVQAAIHALLASAGASIDAVYACAYHEEGKEPYRIGAHEDLALDLGSSWVVGDRANDLEAGRASGLLGGTLVQTGYGAQQREQLDAAALGTAVFRVNLSTNLSTIECPLLHGFLEACDQQSVSG